VLQASLSWLAPPAVVLAGAKQSLQIVQFFS